MVDSPIGRALARRLEGPQTDAARRRGAAKRVELLEAEVDDLNREPADPPGRERLPPAAAGGSLVALHPPTAARVLTAPPRRTTRPAVMVAAGILLSRLVGLVRNRVFAHYFGTSDAADAFNAAFRIPNFLQNLFGEGVLSASFIPGLRGAPRAGRGRGGATGSPARWRRCSALVTAALVLVGVLADALAHRRSSRPASTARSAS